jgi:chemotaxis signal transduction protein
MTEAEQPIIDYSGAIEFEALNHSSGEKFILFEAGNRVCAVPAASVLEVAHSLAVSVIPNSPSWLLGLSIFRGVPLAMVQPQVLITGLVKHGAARNFKTIIFRSRDGEVQLALPVDRINEMISFPASAELDPDVPNVDASIRNGTPVLFVDPYRFIEELKEGGR